MFRNKYDECLSGVLHIPKRIRKAPAVVIFNGLGGSKENKETFASQLESNGIIALRFDFSGTGESEGHYQDSSIGKHLDDLDAAVKYLRSLEITTKVYLAGHSYGGMVCVLYASKFGNVAGVAIISSVFSYKDLGMMLKGLAGLKHWIKKGYIRKGGHCMLLNNYRSVRRLDMGSIVSRVKCPILIIHGSEDEFVSPSHAFRYFSNTRQGKIRILQGARHFFSRKYELENAKEIESWIRATS